MKCYYCGKEVLNKRDMDILNCIKMGIRSQTAIAKEIKMNRSNLTSYIKKLRDLNIIERDYYDGRFVYYRIKVQHGK